MDDRIKDKIKGVFYGRKYKEQLAKAGLFANLIILIYGFN